MRELVGKLYDLYNALYRGGVCTTSELCKELGLPVNVPSKDRVRSLVNLLRKKYRDNLLLDDRYWSYNQEPIRWVGTDFAGYTLMKNATVRAFECRMRAEQSINVALNGTPAFVDFKQLAPKAFFRMEMTIKPRMLVMKQLINSEKGE